KEEISKIEEDAENFKKEVESISKENMDKINIMTEILKKTIDIDESDIKKYFSAIRQTAMADIEKEAAERVFVKSLESVNDE
ncbi:MAG: hypothetical protein ACTTI3_07035, partial [Treponema sp.]